MVPAMIKTLICSLFGHKWVDVVPTAEEGEIVTGMCYRCDEMRQYVLSCNAGPVRNPDGSWPY